MSATCGTCQGAITDATQAWIFEIVGVFSWPMPVGEPVRMSGHIAVCSPCHDLIEAGRVGDLVRRGRRGKGTNAGTSEAIAMTLALVAQLAAPVRLDAWAEAHPVEEGPCSSVWMHRSEAVSSALHRAQRCEAGSGAAGTTTGTPGPCP